MIRYKPNVNDPRVRAKIKEALSWAVTNLSDSHRVITEKVNKDSNVNPKTTITGNLGQEQQDLPKWLRIMLLTVHDSHYRFGNGGHSKSYTLNRDGYNKVVVMFNEPTKKGIEEFDEKEGIIAWATKHFGDELTSLEFTYEQKTSARLWHPLQNMQSEKAEVVWNHFGLPYDYDVKACAPTLIKQHAQECGMSIATPALDAFLTDARGFREYLVCYTGITYKQAKTIINALFCGASLLANPQKSIFQLLEFDAAKLKKVRDDSIIQQLISDINHCWLYIKPEGSTSKQKWHIYFNLERKVLDAVRGFLNENAASHYCIHDGFRTSVPIDVCALSAYVFSVTKYLVEFSSSGTVQPLSSGTVSSLSLGTVSSGLLEPILTILPDLFIMNHGSYSSRTFRSPNSITSLNEEETDTVPDDCNDADEYNPDDS